VLVDPDNMPPYLSEPLQDQTILVGDSWHYSLPEAVDPDGDPVRYDIKLGASTLFVSCAQNSTDLEIKNGTSLEGSYLIGVQLFDDKDASSALY